MTNDLFIQPVQLEKTAYSRVSDNPMEWTGNVMERFYNQFPYFANSQVSVSFSQKDEQKGYALGHITITEGPGLTVPIIIKDRELYPFDVAIMGGNIVPLTETTLQLYAQTPNAFMRTVKPDAGDITTSLFNQSHSQVITPTYITENYKQASAKVEPEEQAAVIKGSALDATKSVMPKPHVPVAPVQPTTPTSEIGKKASLLDKISHTITQQMKDSFMNNIQKNASLVEGFKRNGTAGLILKIATLSPGKADYRERLRNELDRDIQYIYKTGSHEWTAKFGSSKVDDTVTMTINNDAAQRIEHVKTAATEPAEFNAPGYTARGMVKVAGANVVVLDNNDYIYTPCPCKEASITSALEVTEPSVTKTATFVHPGIEFPLFEVTRVYTDNGKERVETFDGMHKVAYSRMKGIDAPTAQDGVVYIPAEATFLKLGNAVQLMSVADMSRSNNNVVSYVDVDTYTLAGDVFNEHLKKTAKAQDLHSTAWTMLQVGATKEDIEKVAALKIGESHAIRAALSVPASFDKVAEAWAAQHDALATRINVLAKDLTKEASLITDSPTVDAVLALNFVNKNNIREFADSIPLLNDVSKRLADMLLKTRIGVQLIDESVLRRTMLGVVDVIEALSGVSNLAANKI